MMGKTPFWIPLLFGGVMILMSAIILAAFLGVIPTEGGRWLAPPAVIISIVLCLFFGGCAFIIEERAPLVVRTGLFLVAALSLATVCNWTAFAPGVSYSSSTTVGPVTVSGEDNIGGRIVFGLAALAVDSVLISTIWHWIRPWFKK